MLKGDSGLFRGFEIHALLSAGFNHSTVSMNPRITTYANECMQAA